MISHHKSTVRYAAGELAFHLAESGVELAMFAIGNELLGGSDWQSSGMFDWDYSNKNIELGIRDAELAINVRDEGADAYTITALATVYVGGNTVRKAIETRVVENRTTEQVEEGVGSGLFAYGLVAKDSIKLNHSNPGMLVASYDSKVDFGVPVWGTNTGYDVVVATPSSGNGAISINNATVHGMIRTGGGNVSFSNTHQHDMSQNATVIGADSANTHGIDNNRISTDFDGEFTEADIPTSEGYNEISKDQNYWQNTRDISLGAAYSSTWVNADSINTQNSTTIEIRGDVIIDVNRNVNLGGKLDIKEGASLTLMAKENIQITIGEMDHMFPEQFQVIAKNGRDVVLNNFQVFTGVINAPDSNVRLAGTGGARSDFRGAVVAKRIEITNGVEFFYDINLGAVSTEGEEDASGNDGVGGLDVTQWAEISPSEASKRI
ncbi:DUF7305 domain-containing protein [Rubellicoccus peritrichatus]|uniref:DUF7305 domain-containing protein n=1 Tax=Rubellicoccus peritrichatus TaxID=3080537 RepID=A0AAQ3LAN6_9BACT|nr:hypothetical protein [Puniceicoccus sp. CR14]WOO41772.1 hypothetical protein RZN69_01630 [Puniceicoccus sp. CR14]